MQPKHLQIFPTPNRPWRILKAHMAGSPKLRQWTSTGSWKLMTVLMSGLSDVLVTQVTSGERHDHLSIRCQGARVPGRYWSDWPVLNVLTSLMGTTRSVAGKSNPREAMSVASRKLASIEIYWDLPSLSFGGGNDCQPMPSCHPCDHLWSSKVVKLCNPQSTNPTL